ERTDGGTALPTFIPSVPNATSHLTIEGLGASFTRPDSAGSFRFLRARGDFLSGSHGILEIHDLAFIGGNPSDTSLPAAAGGAAGATQDGGAILTDQTVLITDRVRFVNNRSPGDGGAVSLGGPGSNAS